MPRCHFFLLGATALYCAEAAYGAESARTVSFNRDIRPIMADTCFRCHGPDKAARMAGLRLDIREEALSRTQTGVTPIVPGAPEKSAIVDRVFTANAARLMPPKYSHKELTATQKEAIRRWVAEGAEYEGHWAYTPVKPPAVPEVKPGKAPVRNPIDAFIQARLAREGLYPSPEADPRTLLRRVTLDLTGLPPTPEEMRAFLSDKTDGAYEKVVDRLLESPRYAEKQTMHWLDAVRYADTCGFHGDNPFPAWPYRDYVLRAFRDNKPFDVFTSEQLAGDLIPGAGVEQHVASAYNRLNRTSAEGGVQPKEYLAKYAADRVRTAASVWLGSTMGCAECHDHKFDPFAARDFYAMKAFFADIRETGLVPDRGPNAWGSQQSLASREQARRLADLTRRLDEQRRAVLERATAALSQRPGWDAEIIQRYEGGELSWKFQRPASAKAANGATLAIYNDEPVDSMYDFRGSLVNERKAGNGLVVAGGPNPDNETYTIAVRPGAGAWTALGIEVVQDESLPGTRVSRGSDRFVLTEVDAEIAGGSKIPLVLATSNTTFTQPSLLAGFAIDGDPKTGWGIASYGEGRNPFLALRFARPIETTADSVLTVRLRHDSDVRRAVIGRFRIAFSSAQQSWPGTDSMGAREPARKENGIPAFVLDALKTPAAERCVGQNEGLAEHFAWTSADFQNALAEIVKLELEKGRLEDEIPRIVVTEAMEPPITRVLPRGNWMDDSGEIVEPAIPAVFGKLETGGKRATRLDLAGWLTSRENPLTARVFVNRQWRQLFGAGLSKQLDDLGSQGEWPSHPELIDWMAAEFMQPAWQAADAHPWNVKHLMRVIVTSHTYRQSSNTAAEVEAKDPDNRLLARQSRYRVDAEIVRDIALAVSGLLVEKFGGPSVRPYQPEGYLSALNFPKRDYSASRGEGLYRRGVYTHWQRTFLHPSLMTFDAPSREECTVNRTSSNTPLQALVLLNDPAYVEAARVFAQRAIAEGGRNTAARIGWAWQRALNREASPEERRILTDLHRQSLTRFRSQQSAATALAHAGDAPLTPDLKDAELAAMTAVTRAILNLHETISRN